MVVRLFARDTASSDVYTYVHMCYLLLNVVELEKSFSCLYKLQVANEMKIVFTD